MDKRFITLVEKEFPLPIFIFVLYIKLRLKLCISTPYMFTYMRLTHIYPWSQQISCVDMSVHIMYTDLKHRSFVMADMEFKGYKSTSEIARLLGFKAPAIRMAISRGRMKGIKVLGVKWMVSLEDLKDYIKTITKHNDVSKLNNYLRHIEEIWERDNNKNDG